jgi:hypothetical protein
MRKSKRAIGSDLRKADAHVNAPHEYKEAPELTCGMVCGVARKCPALGDVGTEKDRYP